MLTAVKSVFSRDFLENLSIAKVSENNELPWFSGKIKNPKVFCAVKNVTWEKAGLVDSWNNVCPCYHWDWGESYNQYDSQWSSLGKPAFNRELLEQINYHKEQKGINVFFSYLSGRWIYPQTVQEIKKLGITTINLSFDDRHSFWGVREMGTWSGMVEIAPFFDINLTLQDARDTEKYRKHNAKAHYMYPGGNEKAFFPVPELERDIPVSFIGQPYGIRMDYIHFLMKNGIRVEGYGKGWPSGMISQDNMLEIYSRSMLTIGFGYVGASRIRTGLKGRDFEIPLTGTAYLTTYNKELADCFIENEEILFYRNKKDMLKKIKYYLNRPEMLLIIGQKGRERALNEHLWSSRWRQILGI